MINLSQAPVIFRFIGSAHPFYTQTKEFEQRILQSHAYQEMVKRELAGLPISIHAEIKTKLVNNNRLIDRFYYSIQFPNPSLPGGWYGWSLYYSQKLDNVEEYEFPHDPKLPHLTSFIFAPDNADIKVLRYVPLRRVTFLRPGQNGSPDLIGKLKKPNRAKDGYVRLTKMNAACANLGFAVPKAVSIDTDKAVFYQSLAPGSEITPLFDEENYLKLLADIGKLHGQLGLCPIASENRWDRDGIKDSLWNDLEEIIFYLPEKASFMNKVSKWLNEKQPNIAQETTTFCHGDFACPQILLTENNWSVVDFDLSGAGDPYQDIAMFMVSLSHDVPFFQEHQSLLNSAQDAYLEGYKKTSTIQIDTESLVWYLVCAEIYYLALILKKDRFTHNAYDAAQNRLSRLTNI